MDDKRKIELQREIDTLDSELNLNYELCRELESKRAKLDKQLNPADYAGSGKADEDLEESEEI